jgi:hypothetical protein
MIPVGQELCGFTSCCSGVRAALEKGSGGSPAALKGGFLPLGVQRRIPNPFRFEEWFSSLGDFSPGQDARLYVSQDGRRYRKHPD